MGGARVAVDKANSPPPAPPAGGRGEKPSNARGGGGGLAADLPARVLIADPGVCLPIREPRSRRPTVRSERPTGMVSIERIEARWFGRRSREDSKLCSHSGCDRRRRAAFGAPGGGTCFRRIDDKPQNAKNDFLARRREVPRGWRPVNHSVETPRTNGGSCRSFQRRRTASAPRRHAGAQRYFNHTPQGPGGNGASQRC